MYSLRRNDEFLMASACNVRSTKKTLGDRVLTVAAPSLFLHPPTSYTPGKRFDCLKTLLKTHLFEIADCE